MNVAQRFGETVMIYRRRAGLSQESLGFMASLHRTEISAIERGEGVARIDTLIKLAGALSVPPGDLLKGMAWLPGKTRSGRFRLADNPAAQPEGP
jgi:transcriptional regulator with XRE-family HTH domain